MKTPFFLLIALFGLVMAVNVNATTLFEDDFNRGDSGTVGNDWLESGDTTEILSNQLHLARTAGTIGVTHTTNYIAADDGNFLNVSYDVRQNTGDRTNYRGFVFNVTPADNKGCGASWDFDSVAVKAICDGEGPTVYGTNYDLDEFNNVQVIYYTDNNTMNVLVDGVPFASKAINANTGDMTWTNFQLGDVSGGVFIDNLMITDINGEDPPVGVPEESELVVTVSDAFDGSTVNNFSVTISNSTATFTNSTQNSEVRFPVANLTSYNVNVSSNDTGGYFDNNDTTVAVTLTTTLDVSMYQSYIRFNATQIFTGATIDGLTVSAQNGTNTQVNTSATNLLDVRLSANRFIILSSVAGHLNASEFILSTTGRQNLTVQLNFGDAAFNFTAFESLQNVTVGVGYILNVSPNNLTTFSNASTTTADILNFPLLQGNTYDFTTKFAGGNFVDISGTFIINAASGNISMFTFVLHSVNIQFFDEETNLPIVFGVNETVTLEVIGPTTKNETTANGTIFLTNLTPGDYEIRYAKLEFTKRSFFFSLPAGGSDNLNLFLLNSTVDTLIVVTVVDVNDDPQNGSILIVQRFYSADNAFKTIEMGRANFNGDVLINVVQNTQEYRFLVQSLLGNIIFSSSEFKISGTTLKIRIPSAEGIFDAAVGQANILSTMGLAEAGNQSNFTYTFIDTKGFAVSGCLDVTEITFLGENLLCRVCSVSTSATLECSVNATGQIIAVGSINDSSGQQIPIQILSITKTEAEEQFGDLGLFLAIMLFVAIAAVGFIDMDMAMIFGLIGLAVTAAMGLYVISIGIILTLAGVAIIIMILGRR